MAPLRYLPALLGFVLLSPLGAQNRGLGERGSPLQVVEPDQTERDLRMTPVVRAVQRAADSVVSIYLQSDARRGPVTEGQGSGVILDSSGLLITNWHVIAPVVLGGGRNGNLGVQVKLRDGRARPALVLSSSAARDLALLQLQLEAGEQVKPIEVGRSADLMIGETVIAIGNPQGHANTVTSGVLSATGRSITVRAPDGEVRTYTDLLQTDAAINQGNSGGALLDITGRLIGINNAMAMGAENIGFAIPIDLVREVFETDLVKSPSFAGAADGPWLGFEVQDRDGQLVVTEVVPGSPAAAAGISQGDVLARLGNQPVRSSIDYLRHFFAAKTRQPLPLAVRRGNRELALAPVPTTRAQGEVLAAIGAEPEEVTAEQAPQLVRKATLAFYRDSGLRRVQLFPAVLRFTKVVEGGPAEAIGLQPGDLLLGVYGPGRFGGEQEYFVSSVRDLGRILEQQRGKSLKIAILRGDEELAGPIEVRGGGRR